MLAGLSLACSFALDTDELRCPEGTKACEGSCVSMDLPRWGCAADHCSPCFLANAQATCDASGSCAVVTCNEPFGDCNGDPQDGCEVDHDHDPDHCGQCGHVCPEVPHGERGCSGSCAILRCERGYLDCDGRYSSATSTVTNGCEVEGSADPLNCGDCGVVCSLDQSCAGGECL